jgi:alpha-galactosidase
MVQNKAGAVGLWVFGAQLAVNFLWSPVFFNLHRIGFAVVVIFTLWFLLALFIGVTWRFERGAAFLFLPCLFWVSFAAALNYTVWRMNPTVPRSMSELPTAIASRFASQPDKEGFPDNNAWGNCSPLRFAHDWKGENADSARSTDVRLLWTPETLFVRFEAKYRTITVFTDAREDGWRNELWNRDVVEVFLQPDSRETWKYKEFEVSPNGFWIALDISGAGKKELRNMLRRRVVQNATATTWTAELAIPMRSLTPDFDETQTWGVNFFRVEGEAELRFYSAWSPTHSQEPNFHVPGAFGKLVFRE